MSDTVYAIHNVSLDDGGWHFVITWIGGEKTVGPYPASADDPSERVTLFRRWKARARAQGGDAQIRRHDLWVVTLP